jgi:CcmD family protein
MGGSPLIYLFAAYAVIWIVLFAYIFFVAQQVSDLRAQLGALRQDHQAPTRAEGSRDQSKK